MIVKAKDLLGRVSTKTRAIEQEINYMILCCHFPAFEIGHMFCRACHVFPVHAIGSHPCPNFRTFNIDQVPLGPYSRLPPRASHRS